MDLQLGVRLLLKREFLFGAAAASAAGVATVWAAVHLGKPAANLQDGVWFQEDLAPCHTAKACKAVKLELGLKVLPGVGQSSDLNPIENAWTELERRLRKRSTALKTKDELFSALQQEWAAIPSSYFKKLVESMPRRVQAVGHGGTRCQHQVLMRLL